MPIYKQTMEITNIDDLLSSVEKDIEEVYFGDKNVFTVWGEYEGTLPATISANGTDMKQYQVYGATGGVGDRTVNYFDISAQTQIDVTGTGTMRTGVYLGFLAVGQYTLTFDAPHNYSLFITRKNGNTYTYQDVNKSQLPFTFSVNSGDEIIVRTGNTLTFEQQQFTNICVTSGTTPPETYVPFGYELDMGVKSGNVMPSAPAETKTSNGITITCDGKGRYSISGTAISNSDAYINFYFPEFTPPVAIGSGGNGAFFCFNNFTKSFSDLIFQFFKNDDKIFETSFAQKDKVLTSYNISAINRFRIYVRRGVNVVGDFALMFTNDGTSSASYQPYSNTTMPIYIGDEPLEKDEYVDYQTQKVYRMINGTLTPTDPPVTLPALPTAEGETVVDYAGSGTAPEKVMFKYRKEGF